MEIIAEYVKITNLPEDIRYQGLILLSIYLDNEILPLRTESEPKPLNIFNSSSHNLAQRRASTDAFKESNGHRWRAVQTSKKVQRLEKCLRPEFVRLMRNVVRINPRRDMDNGDGLRNSSAEITVRPPARTQPPQNLPK